MLSGVALIFFAGDSDGSCFPVYPYQIRLNVPSVFQAPVVRTIDSAIHRINQYPADKH